MRRPRAAPRPRENHVAISFIPGGYTPARKKPVRKRSAMPALGPCAASASAALLAAPRKADAAKSPRVERTSARLAVALTRVPRTNPSCTESVSQAMPLAPRPHSVEIAGATAEPENQSDIARSSPAAIKARARKRRGDSAAGGSTTRGELVIEPEVGRKQ